MPKIKPLSRDEASAEQRRIGDPIFEVRGHEYDGPFAVLLHYPELAKRADHYGTYVRNDTPLPRRLTELVIAMTARYWRARYPWSAHYYQGIKAGLAEAAVEAIRTGARPDFDREDEEIVYDYITALLANKGIPDDIHDRAVAAFGREGVIALVSIAGWYGSLCLIANACELEALSPDTPALEG